MRHCFRLLNRFGRGGADYAQFIIHCCVFSTGGQVMLDGGGDSEGAIIYIAALFLRRPCWCLRDLFLWWGILAVHDGILHQSKMKMNGRKIKRLVRSAPAPYLSEQGK